MGLEISRNKFINCGTAVKLEGLFKNVDINRNEFLDNNKDMEFIIDPDSNIVVQENFFKGSKIESITVKEYSVKIENIKEFTDQINEFSTEEKERIKVLLDEMNASKDQTKIKKILKEIYDVGKSTSSALLLAYIKVQLGW
ncbi:MULTISPECIES: hypothetical protein [Bacillaceae]|uniref:hypothetical protein n=1 Tax=Bacillaceae TaxID=186817 RepID=UPI000661545C|nr:MULTISPECIES: hypothetical protein [Bacillaceae]MCF7623664.1 hypothetical protein [Peribacillus frigoritolerans]PRA94500.1 hypothetical protein CQ056_05290 [Peribacillus simplex]